MIDPKKDLAAWLNQEPSSEDLSCNEDGSVYQSIDVIKPKLDIAFPNWQTQNFQHSYLMAPWGNLYCSGSTELILDYSYIIKALFNPRPVSYNLSPEDRIKLIEEFNDTPNRIITDTGYADDTRIITGAATFDTEKYYNTKEKNNHWAAVCLSLSIVNAAQNIAPFFGKNLNKAEKELKKTSAVADTMKKIR